MRTLMRVTQSPTAGGDSPMGRHVTWRLRPRVLAAIAFVVVVVLAPFAAAQRPGKPPRIGVMVPGTPASPGPLLVLLNALREIGLEDGRSAVFEIRYAEGHTDRYSAFAAELVALRVDVLITVSTPGALAAMRATKTIPTVMLGVSDPVGSGLVVSLGRPGGNRTGLSLLAPELSAKRLELLRQALPQASRVAVLWNTANEGMMLRFRETEAAAAVLGVTIESVGVRAPSDFEDAFERMSKRRPQMLLVLADTVTRGQTKRIVEFAAANRLPAIYEAREFVEAGGFMSYGIDFSDHFRRGATYVDKIMKGARPADLPVEQPSKFELIINVKTARTLGLTIPPSLLVRADRLIE